MFTSGKSNTKEQLDEMDNYLNYIMFSKNLTHEQMYLYVRSEIDRIIEEVGLFKNSICNSGCSFCCHDNIYMGGKVENDYIKKVLAKYPNLGNKERAEKQRLFGKDDLKWVDKACPMLGDEDSDGKRKCTIYDERPIVCREYNSLEETSDLCDHRLHPNGWSKNGTVLQIEAMYIYIVKLGFLETDQYLYPMHDLL